MDPRRREPAACVLAASREHDAAQKDRRARYRNVEDETAEVLGVLARAGGARRLLEIGTSDGYPTLWLVDAAEATGGTLTSVEVDATRTDEARGHLASAGLDATLRVEDAAQTLRSSPDTAWDLRGASTAH